MNNRFSRRLSLLVLLLAAGIVTMSCAFFGMKMIAPHEIWSNPFDAHIFWQLRLPRVLAAFLAGSGLALCGMVFQALFRNPLADPFTLGTASGASCGAAITLLFGWSGSFLGIPAVSLGAFAGAACAMACVYGITSIKRSSSSLTMLLAGIAISFLCSSLMMFFQYLSSMRDSFQIVRWLMGGIQVAGFGAIFTMLPFYAAGVAIIFLLLPRLDQMLAGEDLAQSRGVDVGATKRLFLLAATLLVGGIVAVCGPIGFVGLMIPHICRRLVSGTHLFLGP
ncbi:MAG: iron ABC transporter permease, partial [Chitinispirillaceae bacterium]|nr:iron ABC transporter permease [Chitinispirillaceae bacterium]